MKILHTSDWHIGRTICGRKRYEEHRAFLAWLLETLKKERIDALFIAGDIFDNGTPSNRAQELYYRFLAKLPEAGCCHTVITAGNHDSPTFLAAPGAVLSALSVHVIGTPGTPEDEMLTLTDRNGKPELIVCAVPYLRDREVRTAEAGESASDKESKLISGIRAHYEAVGRTAEEILKKAGGAVPVIGMGHLFAAGGKTAEGDGVRELYVGSLSRVTANIFPKVFDYTALGHLHIPQKVAGNDFIRYSGSPLPLGFNEAGQQKEVLIIDFKDKTPEVSSVSVPVFQKIESVRGDWPAIEKRLLELKNAGDSVLLETVYEGSEVIGDLRARIEKLTEGTALEVLRIRNARAVSLAPDSEDDRETLEDLTPEDVFKRKLLAENTPPDQQTELLQTFREAWKAVQEHDGRAE